VKIEKNFTSRVLLKCVLAYPINLIASQLKKLITANLKVNSLSATIRIILENVLIHMLLMSI